MGYRLVKYSFELGENQQIDASIQIPKEPRSVFYGVVVDEFDKPIKNAVVKLLIEDCNKKRLEPVTHAFTDEDGEFLFGPLCPHVKYVIKVWKNHVKPIKINVPTDGCNEECLKKVSLDTVENDHEEDISSISKIILDEDD